MDKNAIAKMVVKGAAGLAVSAVLGYTYKAGKQLDNVIDAKWPANLFPKKD